MRVKGAQKIGCAYEKTVRPFRASTYPGPSIKASIDCRNACARVRSGVSDCRLNRSVVSAFADVVSTGQLLTRSARVPA